MPERKVNKKEQESEPLDDQPSKEEYAIAKYMKQHVPTKCTKFLNHQVTYFNANKAIDTLLDSPWATKKDAIFTDRQSVVDYGNILLRQKFFHRAKKVAVSDRDLSPKELKRKLEKEKEKKKEGNGKEEVQSDKKKKTKVKLDMHLEQIFVDGSEAFVWMYDPIPFWYYIAGGLMLFAAVAVCLFPLWPPIVRQGVYYLSIGGAGFLGVILGLVVVRFIFFVAIWILSLGRHHLWVLPNLTEDVGFFESFWPLYHYEYSGVLSDDSETSPKKKRKGDKGSSDEGDDEQTENKDGSPANEADKTDGERSGESHSDSDNSNSQAFELVDREELSSTDNQTEDTGKED